MPKILVIDDLPPESEAMLQALYSRSPDSVETHLKKVTADKAGSFMDRYYVGYGHASIGDCGTTTIFIEGVSILAAKAIQDWPLYSGQEASTRYMDFSKVNIMDPVGSLESLAIQKAWMDFYHSATEPLLSHLRATYPIKEDESAAVYERAIKARAFDVLRGFLPAGATTNLSWHTNLRQAGDHLTWLVEHPLEEVRKLAYDIAAALGARYPNSFRAPDSLVLAYVRSTYENYWHIDHYASAGVCMSTDISPSALSLYASCFQERPSRAPLPHFLSQLGMVHSTFYLDFGSFRDLQRHRNGVVRMPLVTMDRGLHPWYLDQLPASLRERAIELISVQRGRLEEYDGDSWAEQYYCPLGAIVPCAVAQPLPAFVYRLELRSSQSVHPTLRNVVLEEIKEFRHRFPTVPLHVDESPDTWSIRRGKQTIEEKT